MGATCSVGELSYQTNAQQEQVAHVSYHWLHGGSDRRHLRPYRSIGTRGQRHHVSSLAGVAPFGGHCVDLSQNEPARGRASGGSRDITTNDQSRHHRYHTLAEDRARRVRADRRRAEPRTPVRRRRIAAALLVMALQQGTVLRQAQNNRDERSIRLHPEGELSWISDPLPGSRHDSYCLRESGALNDFPPRSWTGDKGYIGLGMLTPFRKPAHRDLLDWEKEFNTQVNKIRYVIERTIANFKTWRVTHTDYRRPLNTFAETISAVIGLQFFTKLVNKPLGIGWPEKSMTRWRQIDTRIDWRFSLRKRVYA